MKNIVIVTGMSGAGKTTAISILEDMGYHCIDQFPVQLVKELGKIVGNEETDYRYENLALATNALDYDTFVQYFESREFPIRIIYLDANDNELLLRYKFTRRIHPFIVFKNANSLEEAIEQERGCFDHLEYHNVFHIDTTKLTQKELRERLVNEFSIQERPSFSISFISFGYKYGIPMDADLLFDVRFLPNPYYVESLKHLTGDDPEVYDYVMAFAESQEFALKITSFLDYLLPKYEQEGKHHVTIGIGCTGGQHRSITLTNYLYDYYKDRYSCLKGHRDKKVKA